MNKLNLLGRTFGLLSVIGQAPSQHGATRWICRCKCGSEREYSRQNLLDCKAQPYKSCGCVRDLMTGARFRRHGQTNTGTWRSWSSMMTRCYNKNITTYKYWGGRGIAVCERWHLFENFLADMGERPTGTSIDRINNDGNYEPSNCRWADPFTQASNRRTWRRKSA